jgi:hypothetical protein
MVVLQRAALHRLPPIPPQEFDFFMDTIKK